MAAITTSPGAGAAGNIPSAGEMQDYSNKVNNMDTKSLVGELGKNLEPWQRDAAEKALLSKNPASDGSQGAGAPQGAGGSQGAGGAQGSDNNADDEKAKLLKKLMDGTISDDELKKLAELTGAKPEDLATLKGKGASGGNGNGNGDQNDIQGG